MLLGIPKRTLLVFAFLAAVVLIYVFGSEPGASAGGGSGGSGAGAGCRVSVTADILNVRSGPNLDAEVVGQFARDARTDATTKVTNGFRKISGGRWASDQYLRPVDGARCG